LGGGQQYVGYNFGSGAGTDTTISDGVQQFVGYEFGSGTATNTTILRGGVQAVEEGGTAINTVVSSGGRPVRKPAAENL
jgi:autotransporter passenger strand-loop-strand repeat protein